MSKCDLKFTNAVSKNSFLFSVNIKEYQRRRDYYGSLGSYQGSKIDNPTTVRNHAGGKRGSATAFSSNNGDEDDDDLFGLFR